MTRNYGTHAHTHKGFEQGTIAEQAKTKTNAQIDSCFCCRGGRVLLLYLGLGMRAGHEQQDTHTHMRDPGKS